MSLMEWDSMTSEGIVVQYVMEVFGRGHFLSGDDLARLNDWMAKCKSSEELLLILSEVLPPRIEKAKLKGKKILTLSAIKKTMDRKIAEHQQLTS